MIQVATRTPTPEQVHVPLQPVVLTPTESPERSPRDSKKRRHSELSYFATTTASSERQPAFGARAGAALGLGLGRANIQASGNHGRGAGDAVIGRDPDSTTGDVVGVDVGDISIGFGTEMSNGLLYTPPAPRPAPLVSIRCPAQVGQRRTASYGGAPDHRTQSGSRRVTQGRWCASVTLGGKHA